MEKTIGRQECVGVRRAGGRLRCLDGVGVQSIMNVKSCGSGGSHDCSGGGGGYGSGVQAVV